MIVTILPGSRNFHAIRYNDVKVSKDGAMFIEKENIYMPDDCTTGIRLKTECTVEKYYSQIP